MTRRTLAGAALTAVLALTVYYARVRDASGSHVNTAGAETVTTGCRAFAVSPDGSELAFIGRDGFTRLALDSGRREVITRAGVDPSSSLLAWSPDGMRLASITTTVTGGPRPQDRRQTAVLAVFDTVTHRSIELDHAATIDGLAWSPDGRCVCWIRSELVNANTFAQSLVLAPADGRGQRRSILALSNNSGHLFGPAWARDGGHIVVELDSYDYPAQRHEIRTMTLNGKVVKSVHPDFGSHVPLSGSVVSHRAGSIAYLVSGRVFRYDIASGRIYRVGSSADISLVAWLPDDRGLAILEAAGKMYAAPPGAPSFRSAPPYRLSIVSLDGKHIAGPYSITQRVTSMQCAARRRVIYSSGGRLFVQPYCPGAP